MSEKKDMTTRITEIIKEIKNFDSRLDESGGKKGPKLELTKSVEKKIQKFQKFQKTVDSYQPKPELTKTLSIEEKTQEFKKLINSYPNDESKYNEQIKLLLEHLEEIDKKKERIVYKFNIKSDNNHRSNIKTVLSEFKAYKGRDGGPELVYKIEHLEGLLNIMLDILSPKP
jgi:hypothetical protein